MVARIFGDHNGADRSGLIRLTSNGSREDLSLHPELKEGDRVVIYDYDREAEAVLERRNGVWFARIDWETQVESHRGRD